MAFRLAVHVVSLPFILALPLGVLFTVFALERPHAVVWLGVGLGLSAGGMVAVEYHCRFMVANGRDMGLTNGGIRLLQAIFVVYPLFMTLGLFSLIMDASQARMRACCVAFLAYAIGVGLLMVLRRVRTWSAVEWLYLRVGWVPITGLGIGWLVPILKSAGLVREFG